MKDVFKKLEILEVEGKYFMLHKSPLAVADRVRSDKAYQFHIAHIEKVPDFILLKQLARQLSYLPFELNAKHDMNEMGV